MDLLYLCCQLFVVCLLYRFGMSAAPWMKQVCDATGIAKLNPCLMPSGGCEICREQIE